MSTHRRRRARAAAAPRRPGWSPALTRRLRRPTTTAAVAAAATPTASPSGSRRTCPTGSPPPRRSSTSSPKETGDPGQAGRGRRGPVQPDPHLHRRRRRPARRDGRHPARPGPHALGQRPASTPTPSATVLDALGAGTFTESALELTARRRRPARRPERGVGPAAVLPQGPLRRRPGWPRPTPTTTSWPRPRRSTAPTWPASSAPTRRRRLHRADLRALRARQRLPAGRRRGRGHLRQRPSASRRSTSTATCSAGLLGPGRAGRRHHPGVLLRRPGRDDHLVVVPARRDGRAAQRRAADLPGVQGRPGVPGQEQRRRHRDPGPDRLRAGPVRRGHLLGDHRRGRHRPGQAVRRVHDERRLRPWLAIAPEGKFPVRAGDQRRPTEYADAWAAMPVGVDTKAPLSDFYGQEVLDALTARHRHAHPLGHPAGPGRPARRHPGRAAGGQAVNEVTSGTDAEEAASAGGRRDPRDRRTRCDESADRPPRPG